MHLRQPIHLFLRRNYSNITCAKTTTHLHQGLAPTYIHDNHTRPWRGASHT